MQGLDVRTCDDVALRISGLIGIFNLLAELAMQERGKNATMSDFAYFVSTELQGLYKTVSGVDYYS